MRALGVWLFVLGLLRLSSVWFGFFEICTMRAAFFPNMTNIHGRTFGMWTLLNCTLMFMTGKNLQNRPLCIATFLSQVYALVHFLSEHFIYKTIPLCGLITPSLFSGITIIWMLLEWKRIELPGTRPAKHA